LRRRWLEPNDNPSANDDRCCDDNGNPSTDHRGDECSPNDLARWTDQTGYYNDCHVRSEWHCFRAEVWSVWWDGMDGADCLCCRFDLRRE
jgi:hypothetical protein